VPFANKIFRERFGESHGRRCHEYLFKRDLPCENCETYKVLKTNGPHHWEWTGPDHRDYDIYDFPFLEANGSKLILEMGIDITERKRAEKQVRDVSLYSRSLIEASLDPLVTISVDGKITDVNQATEFATGCSREELIGSDFSDYFTEPEQAEKGYKQVFTEGFVRDYPLAIRHKSGKIIDVLYNATIYTNEAGKMQGVFAAARDITELKKAEELAQESAKKLKDAERLAAIGATAGMVGHDIRNPLQAMTSDVYLAKTELASIPGSEEKNNIQESLTEIERNIDYINKIVQDLQDYARPLNPKPGEADLELIIEKMLQKNGLPENVKVSVKVEEEARKVAADADYLNRILYNLVTNAVQAMPNGGKLSIAAHKEANDIVIAVKDTGVGIPKDIQSKMFTPMFTTKAKGQGFGLPVVKRMTESLGGTVLFESQEGKGTTFKVRLPLHSKS
jgi:PAS domain S-box-containing protein